MKLATWIDGKIIPGLSLKEDARFGLTVALGESGPNRKCEKVVLYREEAPEIIETDGEKRVLDAFVVRRTLPAKEGKAAKELFFLRAERAPSRDISARAIVRILTHTGYMRGARGRFETAFGKPRTIVCGFGAFGIAGRVGSWIDALVELKNGDVVRIFPTRAGQSYALWLEEGVPRTIRWEKYEIFRAVEKAQTARSDVEKIFATMPAVTFRAGEICEGIEVEAGLTGPAVRLGEEGRGRMHTEVPLVALRAKDGIIRQASVLKLSEKEISPGAETKAQEILYGLGFSAAREKKRFLVRISTAGPYTRDTTGTVEVCRGHPVFLASGSGAHGDAGRIGGWADQLVVMKKGDVLYVRQEGGYKSAGPWALYVENGSVQRRLWEYWRLDDAEKNPERYLAENLATLGNVPPAWIGKVVEVCGIEKVQAGCGPEKPRVVVKATGKLIQTESDFAVLNLGFDDQGECRKIRMSGEWIRLVPSETVGQLEEEEMRRRRNLLEIATETRDKASALSKDKYFGSVPKNLATKVRMAAIKTGFALMSVDDIFCWIMESERIMGEVGKAVEERRRSERKELKEKSRANTPLPDFLSGNPLIKVRIGRRL